MFHFLCHINERTPFKDSPKLFPHTKINKLLSQNGLPSVKSAAMHKGTCC